MINLKKIIHYKLELMDGIKKKNAQKNQKKKIKNQKNKDKVENTIHDKLRLNNKIEKN
jgi:hypothetical protein